MPIDFWNKLSLSDRTDSDSSLAVRFLKLVHTGLFKSGLMSETSMSRSYSVINYVLLHFCNILSYLIFQNFVFRYFLFSLIWIKHFCKLRYWFNSKKRPTKIFYFLTVFSLETFKLAIYVNYLPEHRTLRFEVQRQVKFVSKSF